MISRALLDQVSAIATVAGERILEVYGTNFAVDTKDDASPVTAADLAAHREIIARLRKLEPKLPILSEESAAVPFAERSRWSRYWLVDPLDGTREFVKRNGEFTVNIALVDDGAPVLGVVHVPVTGVTYLAARGVGAFRAESGAQATPIKVRMPAAKPPVVVGSRSHAGASLASYLKALGEHELVSVGSSLKFCLVAEGAADCYPRFGPTSEWDTAAAQCVAEVAGADVTDLHGLRLRYNTDESLLNPHFIVCADPAFRAALQGL
ncbi:MAG: 3'(2'),5'-bisphosphate nucleotidase CysQ [Xanthomonadaceae bacterium]|nr:3'(2'),5'-bisphosphate nucleotidase CysQ [Xanthomonadaceae bacterium]